ncbi:putative gustatory receptor 28b isoform X1 [Drosophila busckii]|uniref:putative gustatory receptor 28b isoform X1 n=1 Tax=Drosophila busckii TaxID=30019 RepID=UPI00083F46E0|nr:putative gustatory receptor 28b isoform X1 [Drosophila busckii]
MRRRFVIYTLPVCAICSAESCSPAAVRVDTLWQTVVRVALALSVMSATLHRVRRYFISSQVYEALRPLFFLTFLYGLTPFHVVRRKMGESYVKMSCFGIFNIFVYIILVGFCYISSLRQGESIVGYFFRTEISVIGDRLQIFNGLIAGAVIYTSAILKRCKLLGTLTILHSLDTNFSNIGVRVKYSRIFRYSILLLVFKLLILGVYFVGVFQLLVSLGVTPSFCVCMTFFLQHSVVSIAICLFCIIAFSFERRLSIVNQVLKNLAHQWDTRSLKAVQKQRSLQCLDSFSMYTIVTKDPAEIIQESMEIHQLICEAAATANKYFTYQLLTIISIAFLIIVFDAYYVLETLLGKSKRESKFKTVEFVTFFSCQMILYLIAIISIVEGSNRAIKKSEKTGGIVHSLLNKTKSAEVKEKLQQFSMQLMHLKINFTAAGLFNIDRTLYFTISGALTTYLIILLQFTTNSPSGVENSSDCCGSLQNLTNHTN